MRTYGKIILAAVALCGALWLGAVEVPPLTGRVVDRAGVFGAGASRVEAAVLALELVNSSLERTVERPAPDRYMTAGVVKDMAAGAVLVFSIGCAVCGAVLFWDVAAFRRMFAFFAARPLLAVLLAASLAVAWQFIFGKRKEGK